MSSQYKVSNFMTTIPVRADESSSFRTIETLMQRYQIRHVLVTRQDKLLGIISDRELRVVRAMKSVNYESSPVRLVINEPYTVEEDESLIEVITMLIERKWGSAIVMNGEQIKGIFTLIDALALLKKMILDKE